MHPRRHSRNSPVRDLVLAILLACCLCVPVAAQRGSTAALYGTVTDSQDAVVVQAHVELRQTDTGQSRSTTTNETGQYQFPLLPVGSYGLSVGLKGFKTSHVDGT